MPQVLNFYMDDSGSRHPDHQPTEGERNRDFFALGGILIDEAQEGAARIAYDKFCERWRIDYSLHSVDIRHKTGAFSWLSALDKVTLGRFYESLHGLLKDSKSWTLGCVIHRPGYNARYKELYKHQRWQLCKTAFCIAVERAVRIALERRSRLRVLVERCNEKEDRRLRSYYDALRVNGPPFDAKRSAPYGPLGPDTFSGVLYEFRPKMKSSPMMQLADLALYPIARGKYEPTYKAYMRRDELIADCHFSPEELPSRGVKYSCFD